MRLRTHLLALRLLALWSWARLRLVLRIRPSKELWRRWYNLLSELYTAIFGELRFMNYGYLAPGREPNPEEGAEACQINMVHHAVTGGGRIAVQGLRVLEVGCGRGGGAAWMARTLDVASVTAIDFSEQNIAACRQQFGDVPRLHFAVGDAERLPFEEASFDLVVNVESSHCYPDYPAFLAEAHRVLRPGGILSTADFRLAERLATWKRDVAAAPFEMQACEDVTGPVIRALEVNHHRKIATIAASGAPKLIHTLLQQFAGCVGSDIHRSFVERQRTYLLFVLCRA
jgi:ubiquinone/menaquinone biosynthesis C-methylase UbiE